jgi:hypothetical protein
MEKDSLVILVGFIALIFLVWNFTISARIMNYLKGHGEKVNLATMHFKIFDNASKYKELTLNETGKVGSLYNPFLLTFTIFAIILLSGIILVSS